MKKIFFLPIVLFALLSLSACAPITKPITPAVTNFDECVAAGNPAMESTPRQCNHEGQTFVEEIATPPAPPFDEETACTKEFVPVCGKYHVQCIKAPCPPLDITYQNRCEAEKDGATDIKEGACVNETPNPEGACLSFDGNWLPETRECEGMSKEQCESLGGTFNECASACRNNPKAEVCTMQCVIVCQFAK